MALVIISLLVIVPLALLGWDLARKHTPETPQTDGPAQRVPSNRVPAHVHHS